MKLAKDISGTPVCIADAIDGQEYYCIDCECRMITKNKKKENRKREIHFAHSGDCIGNVETYLHKAAKIILSNEGQVLLPRFGRFVFERAITEKNHLGFIPDLLLINKSDVRIVIEVFVTHQTESDKVSLIKANNVIAFEIDLSKLDRDSDYKAIKYEVIDNLRNRHDLNPPATDDDEDEDYWCVWLLFALATLAYFFWPRQTPRKPLYKTGRNLNRIKR